MPAATYQPLVALLDDDPSLSYQLRNEIAGLVAHGMTITEASELVGIPVPDRLPADPPFVPTPEMIRQHCFAIQTTWTPTEWRGRRAVDPGGVQMPVVKCRDIALPTP